MIEYFAVLDGYDRRGLFNSADKAVELLKQISRGRGHTSEEANDFFLHGSAVEQVEIWNGKIDCIYLGWQTREKAGVDSLQREVSMASK